MPDSDVYEQTTHLSEGHVRHDALSDSDPQISQTWATAETHVSGTMTGIVWLETVYVSPTPPEFNCDTIAYCD